MNVKITLLTAACALALAACGDKSPPSAPAAPATTAPATTTPSTTTPAETAPAETTPASTTPTAAPAGGAAVVTDCATEIEGNDAMQFNVKSITVPASCSEFKITLKHTGKMPVAAMGHNVVITTLDDMKKVAADGMGAGIDNDYVKSGDDRVIAHTKLIGGGESTSVSFDVSKIKGNGPYEFFCSFPGHSALMKGTIAVE
ncbi:azurin [Lysobacter ciconiae]|uniref:Azurin n=1 Tax=Novilysobacter ciconiae TaxID=2781022 RepID=A0A7S6UHT1_9GAMM|nr:azurin [Lysobacter ciconiae]QOW20536.1 azurin [Lysobacter ciconiae]